MPEFSAEQIPLASDPTIEKTQAAFEDSAATSLLAKLVSHMRAKSFSPKLISAQILNSCPSLPEAKNGLEAGCGMGYKSKLFQEVIRGLQRNLSEHLAVDLSEPALAIARQKNIADYFAAMNYLDLPQQEPQKKFGYIFLAAVLHHAYDIRESLEIIKELLQPNGVAIILDVFPPEQKHLEILAKLSHRAYCFVERRREAYYNWITLSEFREVIATVPQLQLRSAQKLKGAPSIYGIMNTHSLILQKAEK